MKRNCDDMDFTDNDMVTDDSDKQVQERISKKIRGNEKGLDKPLQIMEFQDEPSGSREYTEFFSTLRGYGQHTLVERESNPGGYSLVNPDYVGKKSHGAVTDLEASFSNAANFTEANAINIFQKYFSMLSPQDWSGNSPHKFLGSWFLESDHSWVPIEDMHSRHQGLTFLRDFYMGRKSIQ